MKKIYLAGPEVLAPNNIQEELCFILAVIQGPHGNAVMD